jgi:serine/threonine-protein kinase
MKPAAPIPSSSAIPAPALASTDLSGKTLGEFHLLRRLGQGGMGQVYLAEQRSLKRQVAIKIMRSDVAVGATSFQRFRAEAEAIARITHANIVQVYAFGEQDGLHYMALEYVEGRNLHEYLIRKGPPEAPLALSIMRQVAAALQRAAELGIIHRDIKPENILLTRRGEVKVADFGLSRCHGDQPSPNLTQSGVAMGTPLYMSPEQIQGQPLDPRTDIYSFGVTCYQMLAGQPPFRGQTAYELAIHHVQTEPQPLQAVRPDLSAELCAVVHKMMAKDPAKRYQSGADLLKDLARLRDNLANQKTQATAALPGPKAAELPSTIPVVLPVRRRWGLLAIAAISVLLALLAGGLAAWLRHRSEAATRMPALSDDQEHEKFLREAAREYANPGGDRARVELGLRTCVELAVYYLDHDRLNDAERFFNELRDSATAVPAYWTLGRLGQAIVLARQDQPGASNKEFLGLFREMNGDHKPEQLPFLLNQPKLRYQISRALEWNKVNATATESFPPQLERLRQPPGNKLEKK